MKKNIIIIMMAFAALLMTQCKKQAEHQNADPAGDKIEVTVRLESNTDKTEISPSGTITWKRGDALLIFGEKDGMLGVVFATTGGSTSACFEGMIMPFKQDQVLRFYQLDLNSSWTVDDDIFTFEILEQDGTLEGIAAHNQLMFGKTSAPVTAGSTNFGTISMTSLIAIAHMNISCNDSPVSLVTVDALSSLTFNPMTYNGEALTGTPGTITVSFTEPATSTDCYIALLPGTQTLHFSGNGYEVTLGEKTVESNAFYNSDNALAVAMTAAVETDEWVNFNDPAMDVEGMPLWAKKNLGATNGSTVESWYGDYYQWGATTPVTIGDYIWLDDTPYTDGTRSSDNEKAFLKYIPTGMTQYWAGEGEPDNILRLEASDDPAMVLGDGWRMPTGGEIYASGNGEWKQLTDNTFCKWVNNYNDVEGLNGYVFFKVKNVADKGQHGTAPSGVSYDINTAPHLFFPATGYYYWSNVTGSGSLGNYWSSSLYTYPDDSWTMDFSDNIRPGHFHSDRAFALPIRPVKDISDASGTGNLNPFGNGGNW